MASLIITVRIIIIVIVIIIIVNVMTTCDSKCPDSSPKQDLFRLRSVTITLTMSTIMIISSYRFWIQRVKRRDSYKHSVETERNSATGAAVAVG